MLIHSDWAASRHTWKNGEACISLNSRLARSRVCSDVSPDFGAVWAARIRSLC
jgi:hypothetical protein